MSIEITTNNIPRSILLWYDLTDGEREWYDFLETDEEQQDAQFFRYKGDVYFLGTL